MKQRYPSPSQWRSIFRPSVDAKDVFGWSPLHYASREGNVDVIGWLFDVAGAGWSITLKDMEQIINLATDRITRKSLAKAFGNSTTLMANITTNDTSDGINNPSLHLRIQNQEDVNEKSGSSLECSMHLVRACTLRDSKSELFITGNGILI